MESISEPTSRGGRRPRNESGVAVVQQRCYHRRTDGSTVGCVHRSMSIFNNLFCWLTYLNCWPLLSEMCAERITLCMNENFFYFIATVR